MQSTMKIEHDSSPVMKKKKKQKQKRINETGVNDSGLDLDLKSVIHQHSLFFDKLVELIPAKFYLPSKEDKPWFQDLSKAARASAKQQTRENIKKARRDRLDPEKSSTTTLDLLKQSLENEKPGADKSDSEDDDNEVEIGPVFSGLQENNQSVTYEELRQRLRRRIEELRSTRNTGDKEDKRNEKAEKRQIHQQNKRKRNTGFEDEEKPKETYSAAKVEKEVLEASKELTFGHVKLGIGEPQVKKQRRLSKAKELERAKKLEEAKKDPEKGEIIAKKHSWKAATNRAAGIKVHDDPKLIKQSIKKEEKRHFKNVGKWKDRIETTEKLKAEKQNKRSENIAERSRQKKMRKIAKREKKLMRPGFEGRKEGFINEAKG